MSITNAVIERTRKFEGAIPHMYQDGEGNVTVGVGEELADADSATKLPFRRVSDDGPASDAEKRTDWSAVDDQETGHSAAFYKPFTKLILKDADIDKQLGTDLTNFEAELRKEFSEYDSFPPEAQAGLIDMIFNLGRAGLTKKFPKFVAAVRLRDWQTASKECHRIGVQQDRNTEVAGLFAAASSHVPPPLP